MQELPLNIRKSICKYEPVTTEGLTLYPIKVEEYYEFLMARPALEFMQQRLPIELMSEPLLNAYFKIDSGQVEGLEPTGLFSSAMVALALALRLKPGWSIEDRLELFQRGICVDQNDPTRLKHVRCCIDGEELVNITPVVFQRIRPIIAAQNGIEIRSESDNPELVDAERDLAEKNANIDMTVEGLVSASAFIAGVEEAEVYDWEILKMNNRLDAAQRVYDYIICGIGETQGTKWKGGNPHPNPWFRKRRAGSEGLMPIESFAGGQGLDAINNATNNTTLT